MSSLWAKYRKWIFAYVLYVTASTALVALIPGRPRSIYELGFAFGGAIAAVADTGFMTGGYRSPFIPYFLAAVASVYNHTFFALLLKNLLFQLPLWILGFGIWLQARQRKWAIVAIVFVLTFPQLVRNGYALIPEEGYLIALLAFVFYGLLRAEPPKPWREYVVYALAVALAFVVKSTMLICSPVLCLCFFLKTRSWKVLALFTLSLSVAVMGWGLMNRYTTGEFAVTTSLDGYNFWKGNNEHTLDYYPHRSLDALGHLAPPRKPEQNEWQWSRECFRQGIEFNQQHPQQGLSIFLYRAYRVFLAVTPAQSASWASWRAPLKLLGCVYMAIFRLVLFGSLFFALKTVFGELRRKSWRKWIAEEQVRSSICFLAFLGAFVTPLLLAFTYERQLMPLVIPTVLFAYYQLPWLVRRTKT